MNAVFDTQTIFDLLRKYESPNVTYVDRDNSWPIIWQRAQGMFVWDLEGKKYLDLTAGFGVAASGHANKRIVLAAKNQMSELLHAMGDVHPHARKAELARELSRITFERWTRISRGKTIFCNSGFEAVEAALKTAMLATGKPGIIAFKQAYHGLGYGTLNATHREHFRSPFRSQLRAFGHFLKFPTSESEVGRLRKSIRRMLRRFPIGAILVEPIQGRGGINIPPLEFLPLLRHVCDETGTLLIVDEVFTGFGRTGRWFACEHTRTVPDLICLGKALTGGFPLSACVGRADLMDAAWPPSTGEAIHTSTFLGHPVGCAMALEQIKEIERQKLVRRSAQLGATLLQLLSDFESRAPLLVRSRGLGLMAGVEISFSDGSAATGRVLEVIKRMLQRGFILLPEGERSQVISLTPPLVVSESQLRETVAALGEAIQDVSRK